LCKNGLTDEDPVWVNSVGGPGNIVKKKNGLFGIAARGWIDTSYIKPIEITW